MYEQEKMTRPPRARDSDGRPRDRKRTHRAKLRTLELRAARRRKAER